MQKRKQKMQKGKHDRSTKAEVIDLPLKLNLPPRCRKTKYEVGGQRRQTWLAESDNKHDYVQDTHLMS